MAVPSITIAPRYVTCWTEVEVNGDCSMSVSRSQPLSSNYAWVGGKGLTGLDCARTEEFEVFIFAASSAALIFYEYH